MDKNLVKKEGISFIGICAKEAFKEYKNSNFKAWNIPLESEEKHNRAV